jgi:CHAD domain-containing protein
VAGADAETVWTSPDTATVTEALRSLGASYTVVLQRPSTLHRIWLDSADWRLLRAGLALVVVRPAGGRRADAAGTSATSGTSGVGSETTLELHVPDDVPLSVPVDRGPWPRRVDGLPEQLRTRLGPVLGVRALLPVVEASGSVVRGSLLDAEGKTVVRLVHERPPTPAGTKVRLPARLHLQPLRGYRSDAARAARILGDAGLVEGEISGFATALRAIGPDPLAARAPVVTGDLPATVAVARVLLAFLDEMEQTVEGTVADIDIEFLHEFRVAVRRSRSAVKLLGDLLPPALAEWAAPHLKWLGDLTTPMRDLDVHLEELPDLTRRLTIATPADLDPLARHLARSRTGERRALARGLRSARFTRFRADWRARLEQVAEWDGSSFVGPNAADLAVERLARADRRVLRPGSRITDESPAYDLHALRKRCKELRYLLEIFSPVLDPGDARSAVKELKALQDVLGTFQDTEVQREAIYALAEQLMGRPDTSARTLLAMGEIAARLQEDQNAARSDFAERFERFAQPSVHRRMTRVRRPEAHSGTEDPSPAGDPATSAASYRPPKAPRSAKRARSPKTVATPGA